jgi:anti-sigma regulatory factor (Ser/Thr protein kinase)
MLNDCPTPRSPRPTDRLIHEGFPYRSVEQYLATAVPFLRNGTDADDLVVCIGSASNLALLRSELPPDSAAAITFRDSREWYRHPSQTLDEVYRLVDEHAVLGRRVRIWGELPAHAVSPRRGGPGRLQSSWMRYEAQLNVVLSRHPAWLLCAYDITGLGPGVLDAVTRTHPVIVTPNRAWPGAYDEDHRFHLPHEDDLDQPTDVAHRQMITSEMLGAGRDAVRHHAREVGLDEDATAAFVVAVNEAMTNAVQHGGGVGVLRLWHEPDHLVCEIADRGRGLGHDPAGSDDRTDPAHGRFGLHLIAELCADVRVVTSAEGTTIRLHSDPAALAPPDAPRAQMTLPHPRMPITDR